MPLNIRSEEVNDLATRLAARKGVTKTQAVRDALLKELEAVEAKPSFREQLRAIQDRIAAYGSTGLVADKAFYDSLDDE